MSVVAETTIGSVIAMLLREGATKIQAKTDKKKNELEISFQPIKSEKRETITIPVSKNADNFSFTEIGRVKSTNSEKQETPDLEFDNPRKIDSTVTAISLIPDSAFRTDGMLLITINKVKVFANKAVLDFTDVNSILKTILRGKKIRANDKVRVFIWNGSDTTEIALTVLVTFAE